MPTNRREKITGRKTGYEKDGTETGGGGGVGSTEKPNVRAKAKKIFATTSKTSRVESTAHTPFIVFAFSTVSVSSRRKKAAEGKFSSLEKERRETSLWHRPSPSFFRPFLFSTVDF